MTEEHKAKMLAGRKAKAEARRAQATTDMPAGEARREQERVNTDALAEEAETRAAQLERERMDPEALKPDREIRQHLVPFNELEVSDAQPGYAYCWVCTARNGVMVTEKLSHRVRDPETGRSIPCWEVVTGSMPEAVENKDATGVRRIGDTILMRCRQERKDLLDEAERAAQAAREGSVGAPLEALNENMARRGIGMRIHVGSMYADPTIRRAAMQARARGISKEQFERGVADQLKTGGGR